MSTKELMPGSHETAQLLEAAEAAFVTEQVQQCGRLFPEDNMHIEPVGGGIVAVTKPSFTRKLNHVAGFGMNGPVTDEDLRTIGRVYSAIGISSIDIDLCPHAHPSALSLLPAHSYAVNGFINVYMQQLSNDDRTPQSNESNEILITRVSTKEADKFVNASLKGFQDGGRPLELLHTLAQIATLRSDTHVYLATINGKVAGSAGLAVIQTPHGNVAELYIDSTVPEFRGRGVHAALLQARLSDARGLGVEVATIAARPGNASARNIERMGFRLAYTKPTFRKVLT